MISIFNPVRAVVINIEKSSGHHSQRSDGSEHKVTVGTNGWTGRTRPIVLRSPLTRSVIWQYAPSYRISSITCARVNTGSLRRMKLKCALCSITASIAMLLVITSVEWQRSQYVNNNIPWLLQWRRSRGGVWGRLPPIKIYLDESIFSPPQSFSWTAKNCTKNAPQIAILRSKIKNIWIDAAGLSYKPLASTKIWAICLYYWLHIRE